jgi:MFS family permease
MNEQASAQAPRRGLSFAAMRHKEFRWFFFTYMLAMMADNIEHVISYWVMYQKFHSPALGGFAVLSHWLPFLFFSVAVGALGDRVDPRRIIQTGMILFVAVSLGWAYFFVTDSLRMWEAMLLLVAHGCAGVLWQTSSQLLLHNIVPTAELQSAVRLNATARYLGVLVGPAIGGAMLVGLGAAHGMFLNTLYYLPLILWLFRAPFVRSSAAGAARGVVRELEDIVRTVKDVSGQTALASMIVLAGAASFFVGNSYQAQMPNFAHDLGHGDPGMAYSSLLAADAAGALTAGLLLELVASLSTTPRTALMLALGWCVSLATFAVTRNYALALICLFLAGFFELSFSSMAQTIVQLSAPAESRGRVLGLYGMAAVGCRAFSGITVGITGALLGVHVSLSLSALILMATVALLLARQHKKARAANLKSDPP